jgi:tetratricopeptide (TPR) repeat protein
MGLFDTSRRKQLDDLEREVLANPTPQNMVSLIERYMAAGSQDKAADVGRKAVEKFPNSEKVQNTYQNVRRVQLQAEITEINKSLRKNPSRAHYERLADIYHREIGNRTKAFETALEGLTKFANSDGLHLISGQIRMDRFHQDFLSNDFTEAVHHFERAAQLNPRNYKSMVCLARMYAEVGAYDKARPYLEQMLQENPGDDHAEQLLRISSERQGKSVGNIDDSLADIESRRSLSPEGVDVARIFEPGPRTSASAPVVSPMKLEGFLTGYESMNGYKCSAVLTRDGACVAAHSRGMVPRESFAQFVQDVYLCSEDSSRKMDIGTFVNGEFETGVGRVALAEWKGYILGILADQPAQKKDVDAAVEKFVTFISVG